MIGVSFSQIQERFFETLFHFFRVSFSQRFQVSPIKILTEGIITPFLWRSYKLFGIAHRTVCIFSVKFFSTIMLEENNKNFSRIFISFVVVFSSLGSIMFALLRCNGKGANYDAWMYIGIIQVVVTNMR